MKQAYERVAGMPRDLIAQRLLDAHGLRAYSTTWEDTARDKNSSVGDNISDMTLRASGMDMPVIRRHNHEDVTFDVPIDRIKVTVGNEHGEEKHQVTLEEYLTHFAHYLNQPLKYKGESLFVSDRDSHVLMSAQACMLPLPSNDEAKTKFLLALRNYQSRERSPAVLTLVSTDDGTSAHVINMNGVELLYFNKNGERCPLLAERLGAYRVSQGKADDGSAMDEEERAKNVIMVIQIPLKQKKNSTTWATLTELESATLGFNASLVKSTGFGPPSGVNTFAKANAQKKGKPVSTWGSGFSFGSTAPAFSFGTPANSPEYAPQVGFFSAAAQALSSFGGGKKEEEPESDDMGFDLFGGGGDEDEAQPVAPQKPSVENAIVSVGEPEGPFDELCGQSIERDPQYPIRVTMQYYYATTTGTVDLTLARKIDKQIRGAQVQFGAVAIGSLVVNGDTGRTTEAKKLTAVPSWWPTFVETYGPQFQHLYPSLDGAADVLFKNGRFLRDGMSEVAQKALEILMKNGKEKSV